MKIKKEDITISYIAINMVCVIIIMMCLWAIDISLSTMVIGSQLNIELQLTNGFRVTDPMKLYHFGLWGIVFCITVMMFSVINLSVRVMKEEVK